MLKLVINTYSKRLKDSSLLSKKGYLIPLFQSVILFLTIFFHFPVFSEEKKIISLKPNITEILFELGVGDRIIGVTSYCNRPEAAQKIKRVADYIHVDVDKVLALGDAMILGSEENSPRKEIDFLQNAGREIHLFSFSRLSDIPQSVESIANMVGKTEAGKKIAKEFSEKIDYIKTDADLTRHLDTLVVVGMKPLVVVGSNNLLDDLLNLVGLNNIAGSSKMRYPTFGSDQLIAANPDIIIDLTMGTETNQQANKQWYKQFKSITAVQLKHIYFLNMDDFRPSTQILDGALKLKRITRQIAFPTDS